MFIDFFWLLVFRHKERDTIFTILTLPSEPTMRSASHRPNWTCLGSDLNPLCTASNLNSAFFFQNHPKSSAHRFQAWRHSHLQSNPLPRVFIMTSVIVTSSPREREHLRSMCAPTRALSWTVLSLTKPKDKI